MGVLFLMAIASSRGRTHALAAAVGIGGAAIIWSTATVLGLSAILSEASYALNVMKLMGAAYLLWLAWKSLRSAITANSPIEKIEVSDEGIFKSMSMGFVMQVSNPKAIFFWLAIASLGATSGGPGWVAPVFVIVAVGLSLVIHAGWAFIFSTKAALTIYGRLRRSIDGVLGIMFTAAAVRLATSDV